MKKRRTIYMFILLLCCAFAQPSLAVAHTITIEQEADSGPGTLSPAGSLEVSEGESATVIAEGVGTCIKEITILREGDAEEVSISDVAGRESYAHTFENVDSNYTYTASFDTAKIIIEPRRYIYPPPENLGADKTEVFDAPWEAYVTDEFGEVPEDGAPALTGSGRSIFTMPGNIPCGTSSVTIVFKETDSAKHYYAPSSKTVSLADVMAKANSMDTVVGIYDANSYQVQVTVKPTGKGEVDFGKMGINEKETTQSSGTDLYYAGTTAKLVAKDIDSNYFFQKWTGSSLNSNNGFDSNTLKNKTLIINNISRDYDITASFVTGCQDKDGDGYYTGPTADAVDTSGCGMGVPIEVDCDDSDPSIYPGAPEVCGDGIDQNCDGEDVACGADKQDEDGDGFSPHQGDCNDRDKRFAPSRYDEVNNEDDEDCYADAKKAGEPVVSVPIADDPPNIRKKPAAPLIMFLLDDSGSMDSGFVVKGKSSITQVTPTSNSSAMYYMIPAPTTQGTYSATPRNNYRFNWQLRWSGYNTIYFNPNATYLPWPMWREVYSYDRSAKIRAGEKTYNPLQASPTFPDRAFQAGYTHADMDFPRYNSLDGPVGSSTQNLATLALDKDAMYHPGDDDYTRTSYEMSLNQTYATFDTFQQYIALAEIAGAGARSVADAIGLDPSNELEGTVCQLPAVAQRPKYVFDDRSEHFQINGAGWTHDHDATHGWGTGDLYRTTDGTTEARWNISNVDSGDYYVYAWLPSKSKIHNNDVISGNSSQLSRYTIVHSNDAGTETVTAAPREISQYSKAGSQKPKGGRWILIGGPYKFVNKQDSIRIPLAHYYTINDTNGDGQYTVGEDIYLVTIPGQGGNSGDYSLEFYKVISLDGVQNVTKYERVAYENVPEAVLPKRYYVDSACPTNVPNCQIKDRAHLAYVMRQEFANWASFYSRRMLTAKAALGHTVHDMKEASLGIMGINKIEPSIRLTYINEVGGTKKQELLRTIYNYRSSGGTPLRKGMHIIGKYFQRGTGGDHSALQTTVDETLADPTVGLSECPQRGENYPSVFWSEKCGGACQRAYVIVITDGYYDTGKVDESYALPTANPDGDTKYPLIFQDKKGTTTDPTMADYAMYFYDMDLDDQLSDNVESKLYDDNNRQHLTTFTVAFGVGGNYDFTWRYPDCLPSSTTSCTTPGQSAACPRLNELNVGLFKDYRAKVILGNDTTAIFPKTCPEWWPTGTGTSTTYARIDDLWHAAVNSRGLYLNASDPTELITSLQTIKGLVTEQIGTAASVSVNTQKIETDSLLYQTTFLSQNWVGDVVAKCLNSMGQVVPCQLSPCLAVCTDQYNADTGLCSASGDEECWENAAAAQENCKQVCNVANAGDEIKWRASENIPPHTERQVITVDSNYQNSSLKGIPFTVDSLSEGMKIALTGLNPNTTPISDELKKNAVNYFRGDDSAEGDLLYPASLRRRPKPGGLLGDFINSEATYYKNTELNIEWVIAGANDGMLHIFDAQTGKEEFAFIPSAVFGNLNLLLDPEYKDKGHAYFVDGNVTIQQVGDTVVLVGGLGKGGKGWYALNLTAAANANGNYEDAAADIVLWEYHDAIFHPGLYGSNAEQLQYLGYSYSRPQIISTTDGTVVVVGNGYDSAKRTSALLLFGLDDNGKLIWTKTIDTGVGNDVEQNGMSTPAILYPMGDGRNDFIYAGDLLGNIWKFDLSDSSRNEWGIFFGDESNPQPLFTAKSLSGWRQPITMQPLIATACASRQKGYMIYFGTGRLHGGADFSDTSYQTIYGIWDWSAQWSSGQENRYLGTFDGYASESAQLQCNGACATARLTCADKCNDDDAACLSSCEKTEESCKEICASSRVLSNAEGVSLLRQTQMWGGGVNYSETGDLIEQRYGVQPFEAFDNIVRTLTNRNIDWHKPERSPADGKIRHVGWHHDLPINGERVIVGMSLMNYRLVATSTVPSESPCDLEGGNSYHWAIDSCTGGQLDEAFFDANMDGVIDSKDYINIGTSTNPIYVPVSGIGVKGIAAAPAIVQVEGGPSRMYYADESTATSTGVPNIAGPNTGDGGIGGSPVNTGTNTIIFWSDRKWQ